MNKMKFLRFLLWPFALLYMLITELRNFFFDMGVLPSKFTGLPIITVGNLNTGGTGKSPMVDYLLKLLSAEFKPASVSRGYGRQSKGFAEVQVHSAVEQVGDEPLMLKLLNPNHGVFVSENRLLAIDKIQTQSAANVVVLDDAYQHRYVKAGLTIMLTTYHDLFYNDFVLPMGNLRERRKNAQRAQIIVVTKCPLDLSQADKNNCRSKITRYSKASVFFAGLRYGDPLPLFDTNPLFKPKNVLIVTGIANGSALAQYCKTVYQGIEHISYPDHHTYKPADFVSITQKLYSFAGPDKAIITTHKDAVKWMEGHKQNKQLFEAVPVFYQPVEMVMLDSGDIFNDHVLNYVRANKSNR